MYSWSFTVAATIPQWKLRTHVKSSLAQLLLHRTHTFTTPDIVQCSDHVNAPAFYTENTQE